MLKNQWFISLMLIVGLVQSAARGQDLSDLGDRDYGGVLFTARNESVQKEVGMNSEVATKTKDIVRQYFEESRAFLISVTEADAKLQSQIELTQEEQEERIKQNHEKFLTESTKIKERLVPQLRSILTADQFGRVQQIAWQINGSLALASDPDLAEMLGLNHDIIDKIAVINAEYQKKKRELAGQSGNSLKLAAFLKLQALTKDRDERANALLSTEQNEKLLKLKGRPFDFGLAGTQLSGQFFEKKGGDGIFSTLATPAVQRELGLSKDKVAAVQAITDRFTAAWVGAGGGVRIRNVSKKPGGLKSPFQEAAMPPFAFRDGIKGDQKESRIESLQRMMALWNSTTLKFEEELKAALEADQYKRLRQVTWQAMGTSAFFDPGVIDTLQITEEQQAKIFSITEEYWSVRPVLAKQEGSIENKQLKIGEATKARDAKIYEILSKDQLELFATMKGEEFDQNLLYDAPPGGRMAGAGIP